MSELSAKVQNVVSVALFDGQRVLLIHRAKDPYKHAWSLPGGRVEANETLEQAAKRELKEETGIRIEQLTFVHTIEFEVPRYHLHVFAAKGPIDSAIAADDALQTVCITIDALNEYKTTPNLGHSITAAMDRLF